MKHNIKVIWSLPFCCHIWFDRILLLFNLISTTNLVITDKLLVSNRPISRNNTTEKKYMPSKIACMTWTDELNKLPFITIKWCRNHYCHIFVPSVTPVWHRVESSCQKYHLGYSWESAFKRLAIQWWRGRISSYLDCTYCWCLERNTVNFVVYNELSSLWWQHLNFSKTSDNVTQSVFPTYRFQFQPGKDYT